ncbi:MAG: hypothetical protein MHM6MM_002324 [Cercozoa sp. M6MM]
MKLVLTTLLAASSALAASCASHSATFSSGSSEFTLRGAMTDCIADTVDDIGKQQRCTAVLHETPAGQYASVAATAAGVPSTDVVLHAACGTQGQSLTSPYGGRQHVCRKVSRAAFYSHSITFSYVPPGEDYVEKCLSMCATAEALNPTNEKLDRILLSSNGSSNDVKCFCATAANTEANVLGTCAYKDCPIAPGSWYQAKCGDGLGDVPYYNTHQEVTVYTNTMAVSS